MNPTKCKRTILRWMGLAVLLSIVSLWGLSVPWIWTFQRHGPLYRVDQPNTLDDPSPITFDTLGRPSIWGHAYQMHLAVILRNGWFIVRYQRELSIQPPGIEWKVTRNPVPRPAWGMPQKVAFDSYLPLWLPSVLAAIPTGLLWFLGSSPSSPKPRCRSCGYDLTGNESGTCPECGMQVVSNTKLPG